MGTKEPPSGLRPDSPVDKLVPKVPGGRRRTVRTDDGVAATRLQRTSVLREAAIAAERATGTRERTEDEARRNVIFRLGTIVVGFVVLFGGLAMMVLPGPGIVGIFAGLGILSRELPWAERMLVYAKKKARVDKVKEQPKWVQVTMWAVTAVAVVGSLVVVIFFR